jgi:hypothetical protein
MKMLLAGTFFIASAMGFAFDLMQLNSPPVGRGLFWPVLAGAAATAVLLAVIKRRWGASPHPSVKREYR